MNYTFTKIVSFFIEDLRSLPRISSANWFLIDETFPTKKSFVGLRKEKRKAKCVYIFYCSLGTVSPKCFPEFSYFLAGFVEAEVSAEGGAGRRHQKDVKSLENWPELGKG
jgi:hypothetical protein